MRIGIAGYGVVGKAMAQVVYHPVIYDPPQGLGNLSDLQRCAYVFVCVPTPSLPDGACDTSIVEEVVGHLQDSLVILRSTVPPGTTRRLATVTGQRIIFQPEFIGVTADHPYPKESDVSWMLLGGEPSDTAEVAREWRRVPPRSRRIYQTTWETAEMAKHATNAFLALKVTLCNELWDLAQKFNVDYEEFVQLWTQDPRIGESHTRVFANDRGFGGACLPKDLAALIAAADGAAPLLEAVRQINDRRRS